MIFKVGDKVITPSEPDKVLSNEPSWVSAMDAYANKEGTIVKVLPKEIYVEFEDKFCWWYSLRWFETNIFKIGDKVRIRPNSRDLYRGSVSGMEKYDGQIGVIIDHDSDDSTYRVRFNDKVTWWYSAICFELLNNDLKVNNSELNNLELLLLI